MKFNYKDVGKEIGWDFSAMEHTVEQDCSYNYYHKVVENITMETKMLDVGCGGGEKAAKYFSLAKKIVMLDNEPEMLQKAKENVKKFNNEKQAKKFEFVLADVDEKLPFEDETFDLVVSRHCGANMKEVYRVLKNGGIFISEDIDDLDCDEIKQYYKRGQNFQLDYVSKEKIFKDCADAGFKEINLLNFEQKEFYPNPEQLKYLLKRTPIIDGYDDDVDEPTLIKYCVDFSTEKGILLNRRLFAFYLKK